MLTHDDPPTRAEGTAPSIRDYVTAIFYLCATGIRCAMRGVLRDYRFVTTLDATRPSTSREMRSNVNTKALP